MAGFGLNIPKAINVRQAAGAKALAVSKPQNASTPTKTQGKGGKPAQRPPGTTQRQSGSHQGWSFGEQPTPAQIQKTARGLAGEEQKAALTPLRAQAGEIQQNQQGAEGRYKGYTDTANTLLGGIAEGQKASAVTFENQLANNALKAGQSVETAGQNAQTLSGGPLSPSLKAEINAEGQHTSETNAAGNAYGANAGQAGENYVAQIRAAAAQRAIEGQGKIQGFFGKQSQQNLTAQQTAIARSQANIPKYALDIGQKAFSDRAVAQGLGLKQNALSQKGAETQARLETTRRGQNLSRESAKEGHEITIQKDLYAKALKRAEASGGLAYQNAKNILEGVKYNASLAKGAAGSKGLTPNQRNTISTQLQVAYSTISQYRKANAPSAAIRQALTRGKAKSGGKEVTTPKVQNQTLITAAFELYNLHKLTAGTQAKLKEMGVEVPAELTNGTFKGY